MSDFATLQTALSGLLAHRRAIEVIGHNITNANTDGYTRRRIELQPAGTATAASLWSTNNRYGAGVEVRTVVRVRDEFLDLRQRREAASNAGASTTSKILSAVEGLMPEPSDTGIAAQLAKFWGAFDDAASNPSSLPARAALLEQANMLASTFHQISTSLTDYRAGLVSTLSNDVAAINADAARVADLNGAIQAATASGTDAHDLMDQRDVIIDRLTSATGATIRQQDDGTVTVNLGGGQLVSGNRSDALKVTVGGALPPPLSAVPMQNVSLSWASDGYPVAGLGGSLGAKVVGIDDTVPRWLNELDTVAATLVSNVNALHTTGQGLDTVNDVNLSFFDVAGTTAATIGLSADVAGQPARVALAAAGAGALDSSIGHALAALADAPTGADALHRSLVGRLGVEVSGAAGRAAVQSKVAQQATADRQSATAVSLDEEMTSLVASQRAYEASARVITAVDQLLDQLINRTGLAGR